MEMHVVLSITNVMGSSDGASTIGELTTCEESQLQAYADLAKHVDVFGSDVTAWTEADVTAIGSVIGGFGIPESA